MAKFDRSKLSRRESAVLDLAIEGQTDAQMAQSLGIAPSTVNSYWVRIRGKLGYFSRTELVSMALQSKSQGDIQRISDQSDEYERQLRVYEVAASDFENSSLHRSALEAVPEALFVCSRQGEVRLVNSKFLAMFGYQREEMEGMILDDLIFLRQGDSLIPRLNAALGAGQSLRLGIGELAYGRLKNRREIRVMVLMGACSDGLEIIVTGLIRNFVDEIDTRRKFASAFGGLG